jgi:lipid-A-disaccharide synthase
MEGGGSAARAWRIALVAGEASGDLLGGHFVKALKERLPAASFFGIGGPRMQAAGFEPWYPAEALAVRGYVEVLRQLPSILRIRSNCVAASSPIRPTCSSVWMRPTSTSAWRKR